LFIGLPVVKVLFFWIGFDDGYSGIASNFDVGCCCFYMLLRIIESVFIIPYTLYYFYDGVFVMLGKIADVFLGFGITGPALVLFGFYNT